MRVFLCPWTDCIPQGAIEGDEGMYLTKLKGKRT